MMTDYRDLHPGRRGRISLIRTTLSPLFTNTTTEQLDSLKKYSLVELTIEGTILIIICIAAIVGNTSMWIIVCRSKDLRTVTNAFILTLATADLMVSVVNMPVTIATIFYGDWVFSETACRFSGFTNMLTLVSSVLSLCNISINRYIMVCRPTKFKDVYTRKNAGIMILVTSSTAFILSLPPLFGWSEYSFAPIQSICFSNWPKSTSYAVFMISCCFGVPLLSMLVCNILIIRKVRERNTRVGRLQAKRFQSVVKMITAKATKPANNESSFSASTSRSLCTSNSSSSTIHEPDMDDLPAGKTITNRQAITEIDSESLSEFTSVRIELKSNSSHLNLENETVIETIMSCQSRNKVSCDIRKVWSKPDNEPVQASSNEVRMARVLSVVVAIFTLCWAPYCVSMLLSIFRPDAVPRAFHMTTLLIGYLNSSCNPIIYGVLNTRFGKEFKRLYCFWRY